MKGEKCGSGNGENVCCVRGGGDEIFLSFVIVCLIMIMIGGAFRMFVLLT